VAARADAADADPALPFRVLAQTTLQYPEVGGALVELARAGEIPDGDWHAMAEALEGKQLQLSARMFDGTPLADKSTPRSDGRSPRKSYFIEWLNVRYEERIVSEDWSEERVAQQLALIDDLRAATTSPAAMRALEQARTALQERRRRDDDPSRSGTLNPEAGAQS
jgi:hypothetical protein